MRSLFIILIAFFLSFGAFAQDSRDPIKTTSQVRVTYTAAQLDAIRKAVKEHPYTKYYDQLVVDYQNRMKANVKKRAVIARKMEKPQYSDPLYFGHKRKPKKRPVGKRKFCKECEIVH